MINAASPDLSSKTCGSLGGHMQLIGDERHARLSREACAGGASGATGPQQLGHFQMT